MNPMQPNKKIMRNVQVPVPIITPKETLEELPKTDKDREADRIGAEAKEAFPMFTPIKDLVALKVLKREKSEGGVLLPASAQEKYETPLGVAFAVGPRCKWVKTGMTVLAAAVTPAATVFFRGEKYLVLPEKSLIGVLADLPPEPDKADDGDDE